MSTDIPAPVLQDGIEYWNTQDASYDGVLGGFGTGTLPRVDALGSRQFLLRLRPDLCTVPSALRPLSYSPPTHRIRALDVGAGVGRVTADVLLHLTSDVVLLEPVDNFIREALARGRASTSPATEVSDSDSTPKPWKGIADATKSVTFVQDTLQAYDPSRPTVPERALGRIGFNPSAESDKQESGFDVIWCQWCLGHLNDTDLAAFFVRSRAALAQRDPARGLIVVKENLCSDQHNEARIVFDEQDSSLTRSDLAWKRVFEQAGLTLVDEQVQEGLPEGLYPVKMYALR
ncbi:hypothetical protein PLICRDRAFT_698786 [Plicaturopsis crispa FD-325 SS-3]|nr:hypothetical protein PLICRDRAFT_698786 [Plicaturopsis crispa FD-325 SS-3]